VIPDIIESAFPRQAVSRFSARRLRADGRHAARVDAIRCGAIVRQRLGQAAQYRLVSGQHEVSLYDRAAGRLRRFTGDSLADAIGRARRGEEGGL